MVTLYLHLGRKTYCEPGGAGRGMLGRLWAAFVRGIGTHCFQIPPNSLKLQYLLLMCSTRKSRSGGSQQCRRACAAKKGGWMSAWTAEGTPTLGWIKTRAELEAGSRSS